MCVPKYHMKFCYEISMLKYVRMIFLNLQLGITVYTKSAMVMELE
jgi:hypothetical protein